jgi:hypothetical protein
MSSQDPSVSGPNPIPLDYQAKRKRKSSRGGDPSLIGRISDPPRRAKTDLRRVRRIIHLIVLLGLLVLGAFAVHYMVDYTRMLDRMMK